MKDLILKVYNTYKMKTDDIKNKNVNSNYESK